ncbi:uncharacterized protein BX663DRAFT_570910 [Cokeromyces recurvatus]|uniref:uncharacterized protein n=1 Tax=Cokeromyces recurvatus TaxID=90255 RepID=UPI00221F3E60|nr:uncharacterized protein BX663DRAFT_570910 [Cokeromyces recurvatus]KAI7902264.1 hypothetical protein BX663DRAFT_570910 [Cokeromyces recurvatus]
MRVITATDIISVEIWESLKPKRVKVDGNRKRKKPLAKKKKKKKKRCIRKLSPRYYMMFIFKTLDKIDKFPEMRNFYIVMNNALIHT